MTDQLMQKIFGALIVVIIMLALTPVIISFTTTSATSSLENLSASAKTIVSLVPLFWIIACLGVVVALLYFAFKGGHK